MDDASENKTDGNLPFQDVPSDAWYAPHLRRLLEKGVIDEAEKFRPEDLVNRAELLKFVVTATGEAVGNDLPETPTFEDVPADAWFFPCVEKAVQLGVISASGDVFGNMLFHPDDKVNRAEAVKAVIDAFKISAGPDTDFSFSDVPESAWYHDYALAAYSNKIVGVYGDGRFAPADPVNRAALAKMIVSAWDAVSNP